MADYTEANQLRTELLALYRTMPYLQYLATEHWRDVRAQTLRRQKTCAVCDSEGPLECHHRSYRLLGAEWSEDLLVLCSECHRTFHERE